MDVPTMDDIWSRDTLWTLTSAAAAVAGGLVIRKALEEGWKATTGREPPDNPASPLTDWSEALIWTASIGIAVGLARVLAQRGAASGWKQATGRLPTSLLTGKDR